MKIPAFACWSEEDHLGKKQEGMISRAQLAETSPLPGSVDPINKTAKFYGEKLYEVSLEHCPCGGFHGKAPCKHIYRLAMELGIIDLPYKTGISKGEFRETQISFEDALIEIQKLPENIQQEIRPMLSREKNSRHTPYLILDQEIIDGFRSCPLLEEHDEYTANSMMLSYLKRATLNQIAEVSGVENPPKKTASSKTIAQWLLDNVPNLAEFLPPCAVFSFIAGFDAAQYHMIKWFSK